ncbi:MAG: MFS transporter [Anaerolineae bacterium]|nr:MFS transporter [Anaerolineae bacterium]
MGLLNRYPRAFWVLLAGFFINRVSAALIWPFLTLFIRQSTDAPLSSVTLLISLQAVAGLVATSVIGVLMDRFGRKPPMIISLLLGSAVLLAMTTADSLPEWAVLIALYGALNPVFFVGTYAMVADLVEPEERTKAYALQRMIANVAIAVGPALSGYFLAGTPALTYITTAAANVLLAGIGTLWIIETLPKHKRGQAEEASIGGYGELLRDRRFMSFIATFVLIEIAVALTFVLLPVYTNEQFAIPEGQYALLLTVNAGMVIVLQFGMTRLTTGFRPLLVMAVGACFYAVGLTIFGLANQFPHFVLGMVVLTTGELMVAPTATGLAANMAPPAMRARYMGALSVCFTIGAGIGPVVGGILSDALTPAAIWYGGAGAALLAVGGFLLLARAYERRGLTLTTSSDQSAA